MGDVGVVDTTTRHTGHILVFYGGYLAICPLEQGRVTTVMVYLHTLAFLVIHQFVSASIGIYGLDHLSLR